jgi:hypothetical protein
MIMVFSKLAFHYRFIKFKNDSTAHSDKLNTEVLTINKNNIQSDFYHFWDGALHGVEPGDEVEYYFEVWDNDGVKWP